MLFEDTERVVEYKRFTLTKPVKPPYAHDSPEMSFALGFDTIWRTHSLQIFYQITKFIVRLKKAADDYKFKLITRRIHDIIGDASSDYLFYQSHGLVKAKWTIYQSIRRIFETMMPSYKISVIQPDSSFKLLLNCIVLVLIVINIFYIPMQLAFDLDTDQDTAVDFLLNALPSWVFLMEIILNFNTAYYSEGMIHQSRSQIFKHYIKGDFIWDLIVVIPFFISQYKIPYINFVLLLRMTRVERIFEQIEEITLIREKFAASIDLIKLMYFLILVAHMCGCSWHYLGMQEIQNGDHDNWLEKYEYVDKDWTIRYQASLYFGTITAFTIGYGDIVPQSPLEQTFVTFMVLAASIIFGYTISSIQVIFAKLREESDLHRNNMAIVSSYLKKHKISPMLQMKIKKYFEYFFTVTDGPEKLMEGLTNDLKHDLKASIFGPLLKTCPLFNRFDESVIRDLSKIVSVEKYIPGQTIFGQSSQCGKVYFIISGNIETQINKSVLKQMDKGTLGTREFYLGKQIKYSAKATQFSELAYIDFEKFIETVKLNEKSYEMYCLIRDELIFEHLPVQCQICTRSHNFLDCPVVFYNPCKVKLVSDQRLSIASSRQPHKRVDRRQNSRLNHQENIEGAIDAAMDNGLISEDLNQDLLNKVGYTLKHSQSEKSMDSPSRQKCAQVVEFLKQAKQRTKKTFDMPPIILSEKSQVEQLYEDFLLFKKEDIQLDKQGVFQVYHENENFNKIIQEMGVGHQVRKKHNRQRSRVSRMKTFYKKP